MDVRARVHVFWGEREPTATVLILPCAKIYSKVSNYNWGGGGIKAKKSAKAMND